MPFEIVVDEVAGIVRTRYSGEISLDERMAVACQMLVEAERIGAYRLLMDFRDAQSLSGDPESCKLIADHCTPRLPPDARLAYLLRYDHQLDGSLEALVRSRGVRAERFNDANAAMAWLQAPDQVDFDAIAEADTTVPTNLHRAFQVVGEVIDFGTPVSPDQFAAIGELVHELLATGMDEAAVRGIAGRMAVAIQPRARS
ncbi:MAG TPA: hypothetical protein VFS99_05795 [Xanthomonadaceae bacterium]|nr:hypothetical protein [Xanthomonadaceae bacterium]